MDNNFDENIAAGSETPNASDIPENSADTEQRNLRDLQNSVTDASAGGIQQDNTFGAASADEQSAQTPQSVQTAQYPQPAMNSQNAPGAYDHNVQQGQFGQFGQFGQQQVPPFTQFPQYPQGQQEQQGVTPHFIQNFGDTGTPRYVPPQGTGQGGYPPPQPEQNKKRFSGGCFWTLISVIVLLFAAVVVLAVKIAAGASDDVPDSGSESKFDNLAETQKLFRSGGASQAGLIGGSGGVRR